MINRSDKTCYKIVLNSGVLDKEQLDKVQSEAEAANVALSERLIFSGLIEEGELLKLFAQQAKSQVIDIKTNEIDKDILEKIPVKFVWYYKFFPISLKDKRLTIAISRPLDAVNTLDEIRFGLGFEVDLVFAPAKDVESALKDYYGLGADTVDKILKKKPKDSKKEPAVSLMETGEEDIEKLAENASVIQLVNEIILEAYKKGASDIHIEPSRGKVRLRYRIDGKLQEMKVPPEMNQFIVPLISRIKVMANLNIVERRLPQDGKARVKAQNQALNLRVSTLPTPHGESLVIRLLPTKMIAKLEDLGFEPENLEKFKKLVSHPHGIIFVTGPTGSGKSTTLYAGLNYINGVERKIITLEDPIEYEMPSMIQMQVQPEIDLTFARGLRSVLRHDPDVMMVGEVRDFETADIAIRVALTGHLIVSTLHTNDSASGVTRLLDIGVEPYLIASSVLGFMAQRLVRTLCPHCKTVDNNLLPEVKAVICKDLGLDSVDEIKAYRAGECERCNFSGYVGRISIHEVLELNSDIKKLIIQQATAEEIKMKAKEQGMTTLRQDGWKKVLAGVTSADEVLQVTPVDQTEIIKGATHADAETEYIVLPSTDDDKPVAVEGEKKEAQERDRRKYVRVPVHLDVIFRPIDIDTYQGKKESDEGVKDEAESENISAGGIAFHTTKKLFQGDILEMKIDLADGQVPVDCIGRTLRVDKRSVTPEGAEEDYVAAVSFLAIHSVDRARIEQFCNYKMSNEKV